MSKRMMMILPAALILALLVGACGDDDEEQSGLPNPASAYCEEQGGTVEIRTDDDGNQYGMCVFPDGTEYDEWALYRGEVSPGQPADEASTDGAGMANPASVYCEEQGGTLELDSGMCVFPDGSQCEEWAFFRGECSPGQSAEGAGIGGMQIPNPAAVYCEEQGGTVDIRTDAEGNEYGFCVFPDGTEYDEWALYRGEVSLGS